ncbi:hypothetical protein TNCV_1738741 [Trichonephila clavipes]|nr:hypothetical protein TNCV_1738741 [Trichonephila clavipes]
MFKPTATEVPQCRGLRQIKSDKAQSIPVGVSLHPSGIVVSDPNCWAGGHEFKSRSRHGVASERGRDVGGTLIPSVFLPQNWGGIQPHTNRTIT